MSQESDDAFTVTLLFSSVSHCTKSKHPEGIPECNCNGNIWASADIEISDTGKIKVLKVSVNAVSCNCLNGSRGETEVAATVKSLDGLSIDLTK